MFEVSALNEGEYPLHLCGAGHIGREPTKLAHSVKHFFVVDVAGVQYRLALKFSLRNRISRAITTALRKRFDQLMPREHADLVAVIGYMKTNRFSSMKTITADFLGVFLITLKKI